jgi:hypothetical protein
MLFSSASRYDRVHPPADPTTARVSWSGPKIVCTLDREYFRKATAGAIDPTLDGADRTAADLRGFLVGKSGGADQD